MSRTMSGRHRNTTSYRLISPLPRRRPMARARPGLRPIHHHHCPTATDQRVIVTPSAYPTPDHIETHKTKDIIVAKPRGGRWRLAAASATPHGMAFFRHYRYLPTTRPAVPPTPCRRMARFSGVPTALKQQPFGRGQRALRLACGSIGPLVGIGPSRAASTGPPDPGGHGISDRHMRRDMW